MKAADLNYAVEEIQVSDRAFKSKEAKVLSI